MTVSLVSRNGAKRCKTPESTTVALPLSAYVVRTRERNALGDRFAPTSTDVRRTGRALRNAIADAIERDRQRA